MPRPLAISKIYGIRQDPVTDDTTFLTPKVAHLYRWWRGRADGRLPLRREFDITEHRQIVSDVFLVEVLPGGDFLMKLEGESVIQLFGHNYSGRVITESVELGGFGHAAAEYYGLIVSERNCRRCVGTLDQVNHKRWIEFESVDCPLSRDGDRVDFIIGVIDVVRDGPALPR